MPARTVTYNADTKQIFAAMYSVDVPTDRPFVCVKDTDGKTMMDLFYPSSVNSTIGQDEAAAIDPWQIEIREDCVILYTHILSPIWRRKHVEILCYADRIIYQIEVEGQGNLTDVNYFGGYCSAFLRWGSGFFWSGQRFQQAFTPEPNTSEQAYHSPSTNLMIDMIGVPLPGRDDWFFTPPPFCYAFEHEAAWLGLGVACPPGQNQYSAYRYHGRDNAFYLSLSYEGQTRVEHRLRLPSIEINFGVDAYAVLSDHADSLRRKQYAPDRRGTPIPEWWSRPIYCGWGSQCYLSSINGGRAPDHATQVNYEGFLAALEERGIFPGTVVIDDKWQRTYGFNDVDLQKWPDLPGFIRQQHAQDRHVLLWLKFWDPEGIAPSMCVRNTAGHPVALDPTNPAFEACLRESIRTMLSPNGYDADGFKIDFSARAPASPSLTRYGSAWGLELMRQYLWIVYDEAKKVKPDALVIAHTPHPYLADVVDMIRLNDINIGKDICAAMIHRQRVAAIACPSALIDTDNWPMTDRKSWRAYLELQPRLGVPALYFATHLDNTREPLEEEDVQRLIEVWKTYSATLQKVEMS